MFKFALFTLIASNNPASMVHLSKDGTPLGLGGIHQDVALPYDNGAAR
ncbi:hypothetical protein L2729_11945 [Shewanella gelidimarina]|nr:hypothetical protein [Shewanella gelidimarina]MCL1058698.1 hypothetical protein [Shewanella gelidimarina]